MSYIVVGAHFQNQSTKLKVYGVLHSQECARKIVNLHSKGCENLIIVIDSETGKEVDLDCEPMFTL